MEKLCPLLSSYALGKGLETKIAIPCVGEKCALWISIVKPHVNPFYEQKYQGCGLIFTVPWEMVKTKEGEA